MSVFRCTFTHAGHDLLVALVDDETLHERMKEHVRNLPYYRQALLAVAGAAPVDPKTVEDDILLAFYESINNFERIG